MGVTTRKVRAPFRMTLTHDEWRALDRKRGVEGVDRPTLVRRALAAYIAIPRLAAEPATHGGTL